MTVRHARPAPDFVPSVGGSNRPEAPIDSLGAPFAPFFKPRRHKSRAQKKVFLARLEERRLIATWQEDHCRHALQRLVVAHMPLVIAEVKRMDSHPARCRGYGSHREDLIQEGALALVEAASHFCLSYQTRFASYARLWVVGRILRQKKDRNRRLLSAPPPPRRVQEREKQDPSPARFATCINDPALYESPDEQDSCLTPLYRPALMRAVRQALTTLPARHQEVIRLRYLNDPHDLASLQRVATALCLSRERVRQLEGEAIALLSLRLGVKQPAQPSVKFKGRHPHP